MAPFEELEEALGVLLLLLGRLGEYGGDLFVALLLGFACEEYVAAARLALAGEGLQQILFGTGTLDALVHNGSVLVLLGDTNSAANRRKKTSSGRSAHS